jgi:hypothetical protein
LKGSKNGSSRSEVIAWNRRRIGTYVYHNARSITRPIRLSRAIFAGALGGGEIRANFAFDRIRVIRLR